MDEDHSRSSTSIVTIEPEIILHCLLRWLAGGSCIDIHEVAAISVPSF